MNRRRAASVFLALALLGATATARASSLLDPRLHFRTIETPHFRIYFHDGETRQADRLATIAEQVWLAMGATVGLTPPALTHVLLVDQSESANGWATLFPLNTIFITAVAPAGYDSLGNETDWLRVVFTHEFTHIVHLDRSRGWASGFRAVFGRTPVAFPNNWLPRWQIEGLAVWEESTLTGQGRRTAGDFRVIEQLGDPRVALDRANGGTTRWPGGLAPYVYGLGFHEYLADRFGDATFAQLAERTSGRLPFWGAPAFARVYGESLGSLWTKYRASLDHPPPAADHRGAPPTQLTHHGFDSSGPRFLPPACDGCATEIVYTRRGPDELPALYTVDANTPAAAPHPMPRRLATRYLGNTVGAGQSIVVFDQHEARRNAGLYADLYLLERRTGRTRALTNEARLQEPDLSPDGRSIAAVREVDGARELVIVRLSESLHSPGAYSRVSVTSIERVATSAEIDYNTPRWSPDGSRLVVAQQRGGARSELAVVDMLTREWQLIGAADRRIVTPTWTPDGRAIVAAADSPGHAFDLYEFDVARGGAHPRRLTFTAGGALWPDVSADGQLLTFTGQTSAGADVFTMPFARGDGEPAAFPPAARIEPPLDVSLRPTRRYRPWGTLAPTSWFPLLQTDDVQTRAGAAVSGSDVLRRHRYSASTTWLVSGPDDSAIPRRGIPDWDLSYVYDRWRPSLLLSGSSETLFAAGPADRDGRPTNVTVRQRELQAGLQLAAQHVRSTQRGLVAAVAATDRVVGPGRLANGDRVAVRFGASTTTAHRFGYSVSPERGVNAGITTELVRHALGASADATTTTGDVRAYLPGFGQHHVVAVRAAGGTTSGPAGVRRTFLLGGVDNAGDVINFDRDAVGLLRGFPANTFAGSNIAIINADYRVPLLRPERGAGTWPIFLHTVHATVFADVGHVWTGRARARDLKTSFGGELGLDVIAGYTLPVTLALGGAWGHDGATSREHSLAYARISRSF